MSAPRPVFLGGAFLGGDPWREQVGRFEGCVALDLADAPRDDAARTTWLFDRLAEVREPRALVAHGLGAAAALALVAAHPGAIDGLVLLGLGAHGALPQGATAQEIADLAFVEPGSEAATQAHEDLLARPEEMLAEDLAAWAAFESAGRLAHAPEPTLIIAGGRDPLVPLAQAEELAAELPASGLAVLPNAGHAAPLEAAGAVDLLVAAFLARLELLLGP